MKFSRVMRIILVAVLCLAALVDGRPATEEGGRQKRSSGRCQPKSGSSLIEQRALCPFTTELRTVFVGVELEMEEATLDPECAESDRSCGQDGRGECTAVKTDITYGGHETSVTLAFVCAEPEGGKLAHRVPDLASG